MSKTKALGGLTVVLLAIHDLLAQSPQPWSTGMDAGPVASTPEVLAAPASDSPTQRPTNRRSPPDTLAAPMLAGTP